MSKHSIAYKDYCNGMHYKDIAKKYNVKLSTVKSWKTRYWNNAHKASSHRSTRTKDKSMHTNIDVKELQKSGLTPKQQNFCLRYLQCYNATKAYKLAYNVSYQTANVCGSQLLVKPSIQSELTRLRQGIVNKLHFNRFDVLKKLIAIYNVDPGDYVHFGHETDVDDDGNKFERPYLYFRNQKDVDTSLVDEIKMGQNGPDVKVAPKLQIAKLLMQYLSNPINHDIKNDTLVTAFQKYFKKNSDKSSKSSKNDDRNTPNS